MRIAICFSGQLRNVKSTFEDGYKPNVLDVNSHHQIDVFGHSWYDKTTIGTTYMAANRERNSIKAADAVPEGIIQTVYDCYDPIILVLQKQKPIISSGN